jgi:hypothetical protein
MVSLHGYGTAACIHHIAGNCEWNLLIIQDGEIYQVGSLDLKYFDDNTLVIDGVDLV